MEGLTVMVGEGVCVLLGVAATDRLELRLGLTLALTLRVGLIDLLLDREGVRECVPLGEPAGLGVIVRVSDALLLALRVGLPLRLTVLLLLLLALWLALPLGVVVLEGVKMTDRETLRLPVPEGVALLEMVAETLLLGVKLTLAEVLTATLAELEVPRKRAGEPVPLVSGVWVLLAV